MRIIRLGIMRILRLGIMVVKTMATKYAEINWRADGFLIKKNVLIYPL